MNKISPPKKLQHQEFIRRAVRDAVRKREYGQIRKAYRLQPDADADADDWSNAEEWNP